MPKTKMEFELQTYCRRNNYLAALYRNSKDRKVHLPNLGAPQARSSEVNLNAYPNNQQWLPQLSRIGIHGVN